MGKMKNLSLEFKGYEISGAVDMLLHGDLDGSALMDSFFLTPKQFSADAIKRNINDGGFGCKRILSAIITIGKVYGEDYVQHNRSLELDINQCDKAILGIKKEK